MTPRKLIVFVCRGNIARSVIAEAITKKELKKRRLLDQYEAISRGTQGVAPDDLIPVQFPNITYYKKLYEDAKPWLDKHTIDLSLHHSTPIDQTIAKRANILLAMDRKTRTALCTLFPDQVKKIYLLSELVGKDTEIIDPAEGNSDREHQEQIFNEIEQTITQGFSQLLTLLA